MWILVRLHITGTLLHKADQLEADQLEADQLEPGRALTGEIPRQPSRRAGIAQIERRAGGESSERYPLCSLCGV
jgi:hypothetical protein